MRKLLLPMFDGNVERWIKSLLVQLEQEEFFVLPKGSLVLYRGTKPPGGWVKVEDVVPPAGYINIERGEEGIL